mmetsp:Transcript_108016/g.230668  ORF Transcript_108016/g.230668 Transcript_108016/m.230668 type:complete len:325 (+) Transcript_108016:144-1118(+)
MATRLYGNNRVFCKGRFISGPDVRSCLISLMMICGPSVVWQISVGVFFAKRYSVLISLLAGVMQIASAVLLVATALSDPGIMPRQKDFTEQYDARTKSFRTKQPPRYYDLLLRGHPFKLKYCTTCNIYRPPRCTHCSVCENCIERFDHHCPWVGNCIGKRNYWLFYSFVSTTGALNSFVLVTAMAQLVVLCLEFQDELGKGTGDAFVDAMREEYLAAALAVYCAAIVWFTVGLCTYHNYLIATNQTTYEQIKGVYSNGNNPFHRGISGNYKDVLCSKVRPRYFNAYTGRLLWPKATSDGALEKKDGPVEANTAEDYMGKGGHRL